MQQKELFTSIIGLLDHGFYFFDEVLNVTPSPREERYTRCTSHFENPMASNRHALLIMPCSFSGCHIKALLLSFNLAL